ncbi:Uncharacterised protein [BD1-7 clade bacterium]|uniref:Lipoprotein n=1 Tax=BD1-7 clade bacterium TaxID=2029982 RepID=A0A5S9QAH5_9GAMM|nr:Uncharacterised protein [BD1-7 clade bacterium]CAA0114190.1 Uncharacterised protein [BD1-7 clade bacterium]
MEFQSRFLPVTAGVLVLSAGAIFAGCSSDSSSSSRGGLGMNATALSTDGMNTQITARFFDFESGAEMPTRITLEPDTDFLVASLNSNNQNLNEQQDGDQYFYTTSFNTANAGSEFQIALHTEAQGSVFDAQQNFITLPTASNVIMPAAGTAFSSNENVEITWDNPRSANAFAISTNATCDNGQSLNYSISRSGDPGTITLSANQLAGIPSGGNLTSCNVILMLMKIDNGRRDRAFTGGGVLQGIQQRTVDSITVTYGP